MKKILLSLATIGFVSVLATGATGAYFSDTETSIGNAFTAGTLNLSVNDKNAENVSYSFGNTTPLKPTDSGTLTYTLKNTGSVDGVLVVSPVSVSNNALAPHLTATVKLDGVTAGSAVSLDQINTVLSTISKSVTAGAQTVLTIDWNWPSTATDNNAQGLTSTLDMTFSLSQ